jgi:hypothetical protein
MCQQVARTATRSCHASGHSAFGGTPLGALVKGRRRIQQAANYARSGLYALNVMTSPQISSTPSKTMSTAVRVFAEPR